MISLEMLETFSKRFPSIEISKGPETDSRPKPWKAHIVPHRNEKKYKVSSFGDTMAEALESLIAVVDEIDDSETCPHGNSIKAGDDGPCGCRVIAL